MFNKKHLFKQFNFTKNYSKHFSTNKSDLDNILPDHLIYKIPKYVKNPEDFNFPWLINGAPLLEIKVI